MGCAAGRCRSRCASLALLLHSLGAARLPAAAHRPARPPAALPPCGPPAPHPLNCLRAPSPASSHSPGAPVRGARAAGCSARPLETLGTLRAAPESSQDTLTHARPQGSAAQHVGAVAARAAGCGAGGRAQGAPAQPGGPPGGPPASRAAPRAPRPPAAARTGIISSRQKS